MFGVVSIELNLTPEKTMAPKRGQPPKPPEEVKNIQKTIFFSEGQIAEIESAKETEAPEQRIGAYIRDAAVKHAEQVNKRSKKK